MKGVPVGLPSGVPEPPERDHHVAAREIAHAAVGPWHLELGVVSCARHPPVTSAARRAPVPSRHGLFGLRQAQRVREQRVPEHVLPVPVEPPLARLPEPIVPGSVTRVRAVGAKRRIGRFADDLVPQEPEARFPADRARIVRELAQPRRGPRRQACTPWPIRRWPSTASSDGSLMMYGTNPRRSDRRLAPASKCTLICPL